MHLHRRHHRRAISDGMLLALPARTLIVLCGAALLERFSFLLVVFGVVLFVLGGRLLCEADSSAAPQADGHDDSPETQRPSVGEKQELQEQLRQSWAAKEVRIETISAGHCAS